ncbi:hypothetical protein F443_20549 [Phytophthora nicotianae P1569]|uniref:Uncharacterized protein n=2 Tax=Phytophthora nicotianae TaxID=4792 RepID=V9E0S7_PHYNI|nr:hypothetical protein F443_20549 [Phytophthora nicotianae P1569]
MSTGTSYAYKRITDLHLKSCEYVIVGAKTPNGGDFAAIRAFSSSTDKNRASQIRRRLEYKVVSEVLQLLASEVAPGYYGSSTGIILDDDKDNSVWTPPRLNYIAENQDGDLSMTDNEKDLLGVASCCISR